VIEVGSREHPQQAEVIRNGRDEHGVREAARPVELHHPLTITDKSASFVPGMGYFVLFSLGLAAVRQKKRDACLHPATIKTFAPTITRAG
jgi:hypothetical protein